MDEVSQIKQNLNIVDVVGNYIELKKAGRNYKAVCPFHSEKTPSFMVSPELQIYKCFGCGESGDIFTFVQKIEGVEFPNALEQLAEKAGVKIERKEFDSHSKEKSVIHKINTDTTKFFQHLLLRHPLGKPALEYLQSDRKLQLKTIKDFEIGYAPDKWDTLFKYLKSRGYKEEEMLQAGVVSEKRTADGFIDKFRGRIMFPFKGIDEKTVGFSGRDIVGRDPKYINTAETLAFHKSSFIFGLNKAKVAIKKKGVVFVEGQLDVISAHQSGIDNVVASSGTALTINQLKILTRYTKDIIFCFDSDTAGQNATQRAISLAENEDFNIKVAIIPSEYDDLDDLIKRDENLAKKVIKDNISIYDFFIGSAIKKYDKETAIGKKKIIEELAPKLSAIKSRVVFDHHIKDLANELGLNEETLAGLIKEAKHIDAEAILEKTINKFGKEKNEEATQEYMLALLFNSELDLAQNILYKLGRNDFTNEQLSAIFSNFKDHVIGRKRKFDIKYFNSKLDDEIRPRSEEIFLMDIDAIGDEGNEKQFEKEAIAALNRIKRDSISRELKIMNEQLKRAEIEKNTSEIEKLSKRVYKLSKQKKQYD
jgi:DNA primase